VASDKNTATNFINGKTCQAKGNTTLPVFNPATGKVYSVAPDSSASDIDAAVRAAQKAFPAWSRCPAEERAMWLQRIADAIGKQCAALAKAECVDTGKPISLARSVDIPRAESNFRFFAAAATQFSSESHNSSDALNITLRQPLGVVGCISPWNLPLYLLSWKVAPALAAGNTVVVKPSEITPMTASMLGDICADIDLPRGVLNIVHGSGSTTGQALVEHPGLKAVSFTGGTLTGTHIAKSLAGSFTKLALEMGGKNPSIVFADADLHSAVPEVVRAAFSNQGQICLCGSRVLVQATIYEAFRKQFVQEVQALRQGDPMNSKTQQGAVSSQAHMGKVLSAIRAARHSKASILCGGEQVIVPGRCKDGWFIAPTVIEGLSPEDPVNQHEIFGPVATLIPFQNEHDAIRIANGVKYGLAASLWSRDVDRCLRVAEGLEAGIIWVNCWMKRDLRTPFGGVKASGMGREGGVEAMRFFTQARNVCLNLRPESSQDK